MRRRRPTSSALLISLIAHAVLALALGFVVVRQREELQSVFGAELFAPRPEARERVVRRRPPVAASRATDALTVRPTDVWERPGATVTTQPVATAAAIPSSSGASLVARVYDLPGAVIAVPIRHRPTTAKAVEGIGVGDAQRVDPVRLSPDEALPGLSSLLVGQAPLDAQAAPSPAYWSEIQKRIKRQQRYPKFARERGVEGAATIRFTLLRNGSVADVTVAESSGHSRLDSAARRSVSEAAPFPPFPTGQHGDSMSLTVTIIFELQ
jgi:TonB family protein